MIAADASHIVVSAATSHVVVPVVTSHKVQVGLSIVVLDSIIQ